MHGPSSTFTALLAGCAALLAGCMGDGPPTPAEETPPEPGSAHAGPRLLASRDVHFNVTVTHGVNLPVASSTSYSQFPAGCGMFRLPDTITRFSVWMNSTPTDLSSPSVGPVTFDLRWSDPGDPLKFKKFEPEHAPSSVYTVLVLESPPEGGYLLNVKADNVAYEAHAAVHMRAEGSFTRDVLRNCP